MQLKSACTSSLLMKVKAFMEFLARKCLMELADFWAGDFQKCQEMIIFLMIFSLSKFETPQMVHPNSSFQG